MAKRLQLGCSLGMACYCLMKQVQQYGSSTKGDNSSSSSGAASGAANKFASRVNEGDKGRSSSSSKGSSKGSKGSRGKGGGESSATALSSSSSSSSKKWGGLPLDLPPSVIKSLQGLEFRMTSDILHEEFAFSQKMLLEQGGSILVVGNTEGRVELLEELLGLCEGVVAAVPVPLGCNNPSCINLDGVSEASAAKVCSGCKKAHYGGTACMKAHWKEHKPYCK